MSIDLKPNAPFEPIGLLAQLLTDCVSDFCPLWQMVPSSTACLNVEYAFTASAAVGITLGTLTPLSFISWTNRSVLPLPSITTLATGARGDAHVQVLTFERGVEDYTLACGTGTGSVAATLWMQGKLPGGHLTAENKGGTLSVTITGENGVISAIDLEGPTEVVKLYEL